MQIPRKAGQDGPHSCYDIPSIRTVENSAVYISEKLSEGSTVLVARHIAQLKVSDLHRLLAGQCILVDMDKIF
jgi:hypothetical protein